MSDPYCKNVAASSIQDQYIVGCCLNKGFKNVNIANSEDSAVE